METVVKQVSVSSEGLLDLKDQKKEASNIKSIPSSCTSKAFQKIISGVRRDEDWTIFHKHEASLGVQWHNILNSCHHCNSEILLLPCKRNSDIQNIFTHFSDQNQKLNKSWDGLWRGNRKSVNRTVLFSVCLYHPQKPKKWFRTIFSFKHFNTLKSFRLLPILSVVCLWLLHCQRKLHDRHQKPRELSDSSPK